MNGEILNNILSELNADDGDYTIYIYTKSGRVFEIQSTGNAFVFKDDEKQVIQLATDNGTKWIDVSSVESIEI